MAATGRKPYETYDIQPYGLEGRLRPPAGLGELEKRAFVDLVCSVPSTQFRPCDVPLLARWAELTVMAEQAAGELAVTGMVVDGRPSPWFTIHEHVTKSLMLLALRLHLAPQSRAHSAPKTRLAPVSYYDRAMLLEGERDEETDGG